MALLVPLSRRLSRTGLVGALSAHYGSPGRLADYRRQFEKTTRTAGEDPSIFATAQETLAVKAFGDMGQTARLRLFRDRFIAGHSSCELRRHLDSVRVWESHADPAVRRVSKPSLDPIYPAYVVGDSDSISETTRVAAVTQPRSGLGQLEDLLRRLLMAVDTPAPIPEVPPVEKLLQRLLTETQSRPSPVVSPPASVGLEPDATVVPLWTAADEAASSTATHRRDWKGVLCFSCGKSGHAATQCPNLDESFPFMQQGWRAEKTPLPLHGCWMVCGVLMYVQPGLHVSAIIWEIISSDAWWIVCNVMYTQGLSANSQGMLHRAHGAQ